MNRVSYADRPADCYCAICGAEIYREDDAPYETDIGPICTRIPYYRRRTDRDGHMYSAPCLWVYLMDSMDTDEAAKLVGIERKVWAEDRL